jgi:pyruvate dehydrogenase E1 component alpha subunit
MRKTDQVSVCFFGEGALGQGLLYEVMNMASIWKLPVIYVCENNMYNEYTHFRETTAGEIKARPEAFGIPAEVGDGQNVRAVYAAASRAVERARQGLGPYFLQFDTYRYHGHYVGDVDRAYYRSKQEEREWITKRDPLQLHATWLVEEGLAKRDDLEKMRTRIEAEISAGVEFATQTPFPDASEVGENVYS